MCSAGRSRCAPAGDSRGAQCLFGNAPIGALRHRSVPSTRPPIGYYRWVVRWGSGPVSQPKLPPSRTSKQTLTYWPVFSRKNWSNRRSASFNIFRRIRYGMGRRAASPPREELGTPLPVPGRFGGRRGEARARGPARPPPPGRTDIVRERMTAWVAHPHAPPRPDLRPSLHGRRAAMSRPTALPRRHFHVDAPAPHRAVETMTAPIPDRARMCAATAGTDGRTP